MSKLVNNEPIENMIDVIDVIEIDDTATFLQLCIDTLDMVTYVMPKHLTVLDEASFCKIDSDCVKMYETIQEESKRVQLLPNQKQILYTHIINCLTMHCNTNKQMQHNENKNEEDNYENTDINPKFVSNYNFMFYTLLGHIDEHIFENKLMNMLRDAIKAIKLKMIYAGSSNKTSYDDLFAPKVVLNAS